MMGGVLVPYGRTFSDPGLGTGTCCRPSGGGTELLQGAGAPPEDVFVGASVKAVSSGPSWAT